MVMMEVGVVIMVIHVVKVMIVMIVNLHMD